MEKGLTILADLFGCEVPLERSSEGFSIVYEAIAMAGMHPVYGLHELFPKAAWGKEYGVSVITLIVPLKESHLCIHTWPETDRTVWIDFSTCGDTAKAIKAVDYLIEKLKPRSARIIPIDRGVPLEVLPSCPGKWTGG